MKQLLKFSAVWCGACKTLSNLMEDVDFGDIEIHNIDVDKQDRIAEMYNIRSLPTLILLEDGKEIKRKVGTMTLEELNQFVS